MMFESFCFEDTFDLGVSFAKKAKAGEVFALLGDLGAGKTAFAKGFASGLGGVQKVTSPTFSLLNVHSDCNPILYHFDLYRIKTIDELEDIGYYEYINADGICLVEWANILPGIISKFATVLEFKVDALNSNRREIFVL